MQRPRRDSRGEQGATIGLRIRRLRQERGLTQQALERATGLNRRYISRVERGTTLPSLKNVEKFAAALDVPMYQLFYSAGPSPPAPEPNPGETDEPLREKRGTKAAEARFLRELMRVMTLLGDAERAVVLDLAALLATRPGSRS